jgi:hypothetical protein
MMLEAGLYIPDGISSRELGALYQEVSYVPPFLVTTVISNEDANLMQVLFIEWRTIPLSRVAFPVPRIS